MEMQARSSYQMFTLNGFGNRIARYCENNTLLNVYKIPKFMCLLYMREVFDMDIVKFVHYFVWFLLTTSTN